MAQQVYLTFFEHLEELRKRLVISLALIGLGTAAGFFYSDAALKFLLTPIESKIDQVYFFSPAEAFVVKFKVAFLFGVIAASPGVISQLWLFLSPALHAKEKRALIPLVVVTSFLFLSGVFFCFYLVMPTTLQFLVGMQTDFLKPLLSIKNYVDLLFGMLLAFGFCFTLPVFVAALAFWGVLNSRTLNKYQRHVIVGIFIVAAVVTPTPDFTGQILLAVPLLLLFELSVIGCRAIEWFKRKR